MTTIAAPYTPVRLRRIRRWVRGIAAAVLLLLCAAYAFLPWCVPSAWLAEHIAAGLSDDLRRPVRIGRVNLSWSDGVCVESVVVNDLSSPGRPPTLVRIAQLRFNFSPLTLLLWNKVDRLELHGLELWLSMLPDGHLNVDDLAGGGSGGLRTRNFTFRSSVLHLALPDAPAELRMDRIDCRLDQRSGLLYVHGDASARSRGPHPSERHPSAGRVFVDGRLKVPRLKKGIQLSGGGELAWENVNLSEVPFRRFARLGIVSVEGQSSGHVRLEARPDLGVDFDIDVRMAGVTVQRVLQPVPDRVRDGLFAAAGHWDPNVDRLVADRLDYRMSAVRVHDVGVPGRPALILDRLAPETVRVDLAGQIADLEGLRRDFPSIDETLTRQHWTTRGQCPFELWYTQRSGGREARLAMDATAVTIARTGELSLPAGVSKRLAAEVRYPASAERIDLSAIRVAIDDLQIRGSLSLPLLPDEAQWPGAWASRNLGRVEGRLELIAPDTSRVRKYLPGLDRALNQVKSGGSLECALELSPSRDGSKLSCRLAVPAGAELVIGRVFEKPPGEPMLVEGSCVFSPDGFARATNAAGKLAIGAAQVALSPGADVTVSPERGDRPNDMNGRIELHLPLSVSAIERWRSFSPWLDEALRCRLGDDVQLSGDAGATLGLVVIHRPAELSWLADVDLDLSEARLRVGDQLDKVAGVPASLAAEYRFTRSGADVENEAAFRMTATGVEASGDYVATGERAMRDEAVRLRVNVSDVDQVLAGLPAASGILSPRVSGGAVALSLAAERGPSSFALQVSACADDLALRTPNHASLEKPRGSPCRLDASMRGEFVADGCEISGDGSVQLGTGRFAWQDGRAELSRAWGEWLAAVLRDRQAASLPSGEQIEKAAAFISASLAPNAATTATLDGPVRFAAGTVASDGLVVRAGDSRVTLAGRVSAKDGAPEIKVGAYAPRVATADMDSVRCAYARPRDGSARGEETPLLVRFGPWLRRANLDIQTRTDQLVLDMRELGISPELRAASISLSGANGTLVMPFLASVDGGVVSGDVTFYLAAAEPHFDLKYVADRIQPGQLVQAYLRRTFPGYVATGPMTLIDRTLQRVSAAPGEPNEPVGSGEWIIEGGYMTGKAAPDALVKIFPGLNLTRYDFVRMHDWFTKHADGHVDHRMIFQGPYYHLYVVGRNEPVDLARPELGRKIHYEVGIDLLARFDSKYWVDTEQGRIPLFIKDGRMSPAGVLEVDDVLFVPPQRVLETLLVQTNPAMMAYHAIRKQAIAAGLLK